MEIIKKYEFDDFDQVVGHVELRHGERDDSIILCFGDKETELLVASRDLWGVWLYIQGQCVAQEDKTRSFLDALIKCLMELRERNEYALPATKEH